MKNFKYLFFFGGSAIVGILLVDQFFVDQQHTVEVPLLLDADELRMSTDETVSGLSNDLFEVPGVKQLTAYLSGEWSDKWTSFNYELQGIRVSEQQFESIYRLVETAAEAIGVDPPPTYIIQDPYPNAFVTNFEAPVLAVHSRLLEILEPKELLFVIGHELGHIK